MITGASGIPKASPGLDPPLTRRTGEHQQLGGRQRRSSCRAQRHDPAAPRKLYTGLDLSPIAPAVERMLLDWLPRADGAAPPSGPTVLEMALPPAPGQRR